MLALMSILIGFQSGSDVESLIRSLSDERIEVRERSHRKLLVLGEMGIPALEKAMASGDDELRTRAGAILEIVGRSARERANDARQLAHLLKLHRDVEAESRPGSVATVGARFDVAAFPVESGCVIVTTATDYLFRRLDRGPGQGFFQYDVEIVDDSGKPVEVERCGVCSPRKVFAKGAAGSIKVRIKGEQTWFSPYEVEFNEPAYGGSKRIGDFTIELSGLQLKISSPSEFPWTWVSSMNTRCTTHPKAGFVTRPLVGYG